MIKYKFHSEKSPKAKSTNAVEEPLIFLNQSNIRFHINFFLNHPVMRNMIH